MYFLVLIDDWFQTFPRHMPSVCYLIDHCVLSFMLILYSHFPAAQLLFTSWRTLMSAGIEGWLLSTPDHRCTWLTWEHIQIDHCFFFKRDQSLSKTTNTKIPPDRLHILLPSHSSTNPNPPNCDDILIVIEPSDHIKNEGGQVGQFPPLTVLSGIIFQQLQYLLPLRRLHTSSLSTVGPPMSTFSSCILFYCDFYFLPSVM